MIVVCANMLEEKFNTDEFVLIGLCDGQEQAFDFIFRKYYKALCAQANCYVKDLDKSQSLVQDCFVKLWDKREQARNITTLSSYLSFMVRNKCIDYLRTLKSESNQNQKVCFQQEGDNTEEIFVGHEFEEQLVAALALLPARSREAFEYSRFQQLSYKEIADKMDISVKAVEALMGRALKILRKELKDYLPILIAFYNITKF